MKRNRKKCEVIAECQMIYQPVCTEEFAVTIPLKICDPIFGLTLTSLERQQDVKMPRCKMFVMQSMEQLNIVRR